MICNDLEQPCPGHSHRYGRHPAAYLPYSNLQGSEKLRRKDAMNKFMKTQKKIEDKFTNAFLTPDAATGKEEGGEGSSGEDSSSKA